MKATKYTKKQFENASHRHFVKLMNATKTVSSCKSKELQEATRNIVLINACLLAGIKPNKYKLSIR